MQETNKPTILIIDDEMPYIYILQTILEAEGYNIQFALTGKEALTLLEKQKPDLILLDLALPDMDGMQLMTKIVADNTTRDIPILIISIRKEPEDVITGLDKGAIDYIRKPVEERELRARVRNALRIKKREDELKSLLIEKENIIKSLSVN